LNIKVLHVYCGPFPTSQGTQTLIKQTCTLTAGNYDVHLLCYRHGDNTADDLPFKIHRINRTFGFKSKRSGIAWQKLPLDINMVKKLNELTAELCPQIIHAHHFEALTVCCAAASFGKTALIFHHHALLGPELETYVPAPFKLPLKFLGFAMDKFLPLLATHIIAINREIAQNVSRISTLKSRTTLLYPPATFTPSYNHLNNANPSKTSANITSKPVTGLYIGNLDSYQGVNNLITAVTQIAADTTCSWCKKRFRLHIVTDSDTHFVRLAIKKNNTEDLIKIYRHKNFKNAQKHIINCDFVIIPRFLKGGIPIKLINGLAAGKPCIMDRGLGEYLTHGHDAWLINMKSTKQIKEAICTFVNNPNLLADIGKNALAASKKHHDSSAYAKKISNIYRSILKISNKPD
jgi:glycosyltransferase involved in cell wall biosynthesis